MKAFSWCVVCVVCGPPLRWKKKKNSEDFSVCYPPGEGMMFLATTPSDMSPLSRALNLKTPLLLSSLKVTHNPAPEPTSRHSHSCGALFLVLLLLFLNFFTFLSLYSYLLSCFFYFVHIGLLYYY